MRRLKHIATRLLLAGALLATPFAANIQADAATAQQINANTQQTLNSFTRQIRGGGDVLRNARGVLVFPRVYQAGIGIGGEYGEGALLVNGKVENYYRLTSGSFGFQLGGQRKAIIIAFMNDEALNRFRQSSGWEIGADASAAMLVVGAEGSITNINLNRPVLGFVVDQKGLMYNLTLEGSKITPIRR